MSISDVDTDGDGLTDWEEYQLGLDPFSPNSNGKTDAKGQPITDFAYAKQWAAVAMANQAPAISGAQPVREALIVYPKAGEATGTGLLGNYYTNSSTTYTNSANFNPANLFWTTH